MLSKTDSHSRAGKNAAAGFYLATSQLLTAFAITPLVQRGLGIEDFGLYVIFGQGANMLLLANPYPTNFVQWNAARDPANLGRTVGAAQAAYSRALFIFCFVLFCGVGAMVFMGSLDSRRALALALFGVAFMISRATSTYDFALTGLLKQTMFVRRRIAINLAAGVFNVAATRAGLGLVAIGVVSCVANLSVFAIQRRMVIGFCLGKGSVNSDWRVFIRHYQGESRQAYWGEVLYALSNWELVFLGVISTAASTAAYAITGSLQRQGWGMVNAGIGGALPLVGSLHVTARGNAAEKIVLRMNLAVFRLSVGAAALVMLVASHIITWLYGPNIFLGPEYAVPITAVVVVSGLGLLNVQCWQYLGRPRFGNLLLVSGLIGAVALGLLGWMIYGLKGFVWGMLLGRTFAPVGTIFALSRATGNGMGRATLFVILIWAGWIGLALVGEAVDRALAVSIALSLAAVMAWLLFKDLRFFLNVRGQIAPIEVQ